MERDDENFFVTYIVEVMLFKYIFAGIQILIGYICLKEFEGRKINLFFLIIILTFGFDSICSISNLFFKLNDFLDKEFLMQMLIKI